MRSLPELLDRCRERGMRITAPRLAIFRTLSQSKTHPSAEELFGEVRRQHPTVSFATVYNTLQLLTEMGEVRQIVVGELRRRYDPNVSDHQHAVCRQCHALVDVSVDVSALEHIDLSAHDFQVEGVRVEFAGLCGRCAGKEQAESKSSQS